MTARYPRIRVSGDAANRSHQYGALAQQYIARTRAGYERTFAAKGISWDAACETAREYLPAIEQFFPHLATELRGIAEGSGLPFADILAMNCRTEIMWRAAVEQAHRITAWTGETSTASECSSFALEPDRTELGRALVGQNWDWYELLGEGVIVLEVERTDGPNYVTIVEAGLLAKTSMNAAGLGIGINTLVSSRDGGGHGVPFHVLVRAVADAELVSDVVETLSSVPRASSGNYIIASADGAVLNVEVAPGGAQTVRPVCAMNGAVVHTNHFVREPAPGFDLAPVQMADSFVRYGRMSRLIADAPAPLTVSDLQLALADHADAPNSVCCHPDTRVAAASRWATLVSVVMDPATRTMHLAEGTPCDHAWQEHDYSGLLG